MNFFITHWSKDIWSQMSYSFVKTGGSGEAYDVLAEDVQGKVFFAGEVTFFEFLPNESRNVRFYEVLLRHLFHFYCT